MKVVVVTGAASGIGWAIVETLHKAGFFVCVTDCDDEKLSALQQDLGSHLNVERLLFLSLDVTKINSIQTAQEKIHAHWGNVYGLINNAGVSDRVDFIEIEEKQFQHILDVNLTGVFRVSQLFVKDMIEKKEGKIVNISSLSALKGAAKAAPYAASKAGVVALTKTMAVELAPFNIQVNAILPGYIDTPMLKEHRQALAQIAAWKVPVKRLGYAWEVAEMVGNLMNAKSAYLTGSDIVIDGGFSCV